MKYGRSTDLGLRCIRSTIAWEHISYDFSLFNWCWKCKPVLIQLVLDSRIRKKNAKKWDHDRHIRLNMTYKCKGSQASTRTKTSTEADANMVPCANWVVIDSPAQKSFFVEGFENDFAFYKRRTIAKSSAANCASYLSNAIRMVPLKLKINRFSLPVTPSR